jgi:hypothetical protein
MIERVDDVIALDDLSAATSILEILSLPRSRGLKIYIMHALIPNLSCQMIPGAFKIYVASDLKYFCKVYILHSENPQKIAVCTYFTSTSDRK